MDKERSNSIDMLNGPLLGKIVLFAIPLALSSILQQLFNSADSVVAGHLVGSTALAAIGGVTVVISLFTVLFVGLSVGTNVVIAVHIGHGETHKIKGAIQTTVVVTLAGSLLLTAAGILFTDPILAAITMPEDAWEEATQYLHVYFGGVVFFLIYNFGSAILRAKGDTRRPLYALAVAVVLNIILNLVAVIVFNGGVAGIALATVISNAASAGLVVWFLLNEEKDFRLDFSDFHVVGADLRKLLYIGLPAGLQGVVFALSNVVIQGAINGFGSAATAGAAAAMNYEYYTYFFVNAFAQTAVTFVGQNYAARKLERCDKVVKLCMALALGCSTVLCFTFVVLFCEEAISVFTTDATAMTFAVIRMWQVELLEVMPCSYEITASAMRGMGWSVLPMIVTIIGSCVLRVIYILAIFPAINTYEGIYYIYPITWVVTGTTMVILFFIARKRAYAKA